MTYSPHDRSVVQPDSNYFEVLKTKIADGVVISRYIYGSNEFVSRDSFRIKQYYAGPQELYQRDVIVDSVQAVFKLGDQFFFTEYKQLIDSLVSYITSKK